MSIGKEEESLVSIFSSSKALSLSYDKVRINTLIVQLPSTSKKDVVVEKRITEIKKT